MGLPLPVANVIDHFDIGPLTVERRGAPTRNSYGEMVPAAKVDIVLKPVAVHVASSRERQVLPEALRNQESVRVYTKTRLYVGDGSTDVLLYQGRRYVVSFTDDYDANGRVFLSMATLEEAAQP